jgi:hypothetical protein
VQEGQKEHNLDSHDIVRISNYWCQVAWPRSKPQ